MFSENRFTYQEVPHQDPAEDATLASSSENPEVVNNPSEAETIQETSEAQRSLAQELENEAETTGSNPEDEIETQSENDRARPLTIRVARQRPSQAPRRLTEGFRQEVERRLNDSQSNLDIAPALRASINSIQARYLDSTWNYFRLSLHDNNPERGIYSSQRARSDAVQTDINENYQAFIDSPAYEDALNFYIQVLTHIARNDTPPGNPELNFNRGSLGRLSAILTTAVPGIALGRTNLEGNPNHQFFELVQIISSREGSEFNNNELERIANFIQNNLDYQSYLAQARSQNIQGVSDIDGSQGMLSHALRDLLNLEQSQQLSQYILNRYTNPETQNPSDLQSLTNLSTLSQAGFTPYMLEEIMENLDLDPSLVENIRANISQNQDNHSQVMDFASATPAEINTNSDNIINSNSRLAAAGGMLWAGVAALSNLMVGISRGNASAIATAAALTAGATVAADHMLGKAPLATISSFFRGQIVPRSEVLALNEAASHRLISETWLYNPTPSTVKAMENPSFIQVLNQTFTYATSNESDFDFDMIKTGLRRSALNQRGAEQIATYQAIQDLENYFRTNQMSPDMINQQLLALGVAYNQLNIIDTNSFREHFRSSSQYRSDTPTAARTVPPEAHEASRQTPNQPSSDSSQNRRRREIPQGSRESTIPHGRIDQSDINSSIQEIQDQNIQARSERLREREYIMNEDITIPPGITIFIQAGTELRVHGGGMNGDGRIEHVSNTMENNPSAINENNQTLNLAQYTEEIKIAVQTTGLRITQDIYLKSTTASPIVLPRHLKVKGRVDAFLS